jgi:hypothetical protein
VLAGLRRVRVKHQVGEQRVLARLVNGGHQPIVPDEAQATQQRGFETHSARLSDVHHS